MKRFIKKLLTGLLALTMVLGITSASVYASTLQIGNDEDIKYVMNTRKQAKHEELIVDDNYIRYYLISGERPSVGDPIILDEYGYCAGGCNNNVQNVLEYSKISRTYRLKIQCLDCINSMEIVIYPDEESTPIVQDFKRAVEEILAKEKKEENIKQAVIAVIVLGIVVAGGIVIIVKMKKKQQ